MYWSSKEQRVLAEEEIEEKTKFAPTYLVKCKISKFGEASNDIKNLGEVSLWAFVTEPWKLSSTQGLVVNPNETYALVKIKEKEYIIVALDRVGELGVRLGKPLITDLYTKGQVLYDLIAQHPLFPNKELHIIPSEGWKTSFGTGINLISPLSSLIDLEIADKYKLSTDSYLTREGLFNSDLGSEFEGLNPFTDGNELCLDLMKVNKCILLSYDHEYEYTRVKQTKERVILNSLDSWFFRVSEGLKQKWFQEVAFTKFRPSLNIKELDEVNSDYENLKQDEFKSIKKNELDSYYFNVVEELNDFNEWCISEKNFWGIPIPYFYNKRGNEILWNQEIILHVAKIFREQGSDAWFKLKIEELLPLAYRELAPNLIKGDEVFDVWFDNSLTWKTVLLNKESQDSILDEEERKVEGLINLNHPDYVSLSALIKDLKDQSEKQLKVGRKSLTKMNKLKQERDKLISEHIIKRNKLSKDIDIENFKRIIPSANLLGDDKIKELINRKMNASSKSSIDTSLFPANMVVEGFDQHSRWFLTSIITSVALNSSVPFDTIKTHGLIFDENGKKMSKTLKNYIDPRDIIEGTEKLEGEREYGFGADVLRLWCATNDSDKILTLDNSALQQLQKTLKAIRSQVRVMLGMLRDFNVNTKIDPDKLSYMDQLALLKLHELITEATSQFEGKMVLCWIKH